MFISSDFHLKYLIFTANLKALNHETHSYHTLCFSIGFALKCRSENIIFYPFNTQ